MKFCEMPYQRPDLDEVLRTCAGFAANIRDAASDEELVCLYREENEYLGHYATAQILANIHYTQDTRNGTWAAEQDWFDTNGPAVANAEADIARALLANPHVSALEKAFGSTVLPTLKNRVLSMDERVLELQKEENALSSAYQKLYGGAD
ncbi:MAG: M3 family oligoendopeptidase, partial [Gemmiger sp.]